jgi:adenine-specific DNA-methyltransferase
MGLFDEEENRLFKNTETNGRYHSDWCSMMYPRLQLARNLLTDDGVIFISIDDNEVHNLRKICDEVFGEENFVAAATRKRRDSQANLSKNISPIHEYVIIYKKSLGILNRVPANINEMIIKIQTTILEGPM